MSTNLNKAYAIKSRFVLIIIFVSIETLDLNTLKKDISTDQEISISISIGLDSRDLQA